MASGGLCVLIYQWEVTLLCSGCLQKLNKPRFSDLDSLWEQRLLGVVSTLLPWCFQGRAGYIQIFGGDHRGVSQGLMNSPSPPP